MLSCLSYRLSNASQLPGIQEECIGKRARSIVRISSIELCFQNDRDSKTRPSQWNLSEEQSDRLAPTYEAYVLSDVQPPQRVWPEKEALWQQLVALYHKFFEEEQRRLFQKPGEETSVHD